MELWDVLDEDRNRLDKYCVRGETKLLAGEYHLGVAVCVVNDKREFLLTKRAPGKDYAYTWENTGGAVLSGEQSRHAAVRELLEETGIEAAEDELQFLRSFTERNDHLIFDIYLLRRNLPAEEVVFFR